MISLQDVYSCCYISQSVALSIPVMGRYIMVSSLNHLTTIASLPKPPNISRQEQATRDIDQKRESRGTHQNSIPQDRWRRTFSIQAGVRRASASERQRARIAVVVTCSPNERTVLSVSSTTVRIAPAPAIPGTARGKTARCSGVASGGMEAASSVTLPSTIFSPNSNRISEPAS
ncbi:hypothetical protein FGO68_gene13988 [Halteria grandinella]|uniref:Uncharacterized protein n=1 Tax=Halteria grandinella TaxID=5974 RepID=A0A8J8SY14_HALGN|nr:hypothetical protein FGO68_gene13988 [Halteria grandinella]